MKVARLQASGLLPLQMEGKRKYYRANPEAPVLPELQSFLIKTVGLGDLLKDHLRRASDEITVAFVYGSYAR